MSKLKINIVMANDIITLSEFKARHERLKKLVSNWKNVALIAISFITVKIMAEQLAMIFIRRMYQ